MSSLHNTSLVARREFSERAGSRAFLLSTILLAGMAMVFGGVALLIAGARRRA